MRRTGRSQAQKAAIKAWMYCTQNAKRRQMEHTRRPSPGGNRRRSSSAVADAGTGGSQAEQTTLGRGRTARRTQTRRGRLAGKEAAHGTRVGTVPRHVQAVIDRQAAADELRRTEAERWRSKQPTKVWMQRSRSQGGGRMPLRTLTQRERPRWPPGTHEPDDHTHGRSVQVNASQRR